MLKGMWRNYNTHEGSEVIFLRVQFRYSVIKITAINQLRLLYSPNAPHVAQDIHN